MAKSYMVVTKEDWIAASAKQREWMMFNTIQEMNTRLDKVEAKPIYDKMCAFMGGIIGGALAFMGLKVV